MIPAARDAKQEPPARQDRVAEDDCDDDPHQDRAHLVALAGFLLVSVDDLFALPRRDGSDLRLVAVVRIVVD